MNKKFFGIFLLIFIFWLYNTTVFEYIDFADLLKSVRFFLFSLLREGLDLMIFIILFLLITSPLILKLFRGEVTKIIFMDDYVNLLALLSTTLIVIKSRNFDDRLLMALIIIFTLLFLFSKGFGVRELEKIEYLDPQAHRSSETWFDLEGNFNHSLFRSWFLSKIKTELVLTSIAWAILFYGVTELLIYFDLCPCSEVWEMIVYRVFQFGGCFLIYFTYFLLFEHILLSEMEKGFLILSTFTALISVTIPPFFFYEALISLSSSFEINLVKYIPIMGFIQFFFFFYLLKNFWCCNTKFGLLKNIELYIYYSILILQIILIWRVICSEIFLEIIFRGGF